jgi:LysM repeat protein
MKLVNIFESDFNKKPQRAVAEGGPYDLPGIDYDRPGDTPLKRRSAPSDYPYSKEQDDDHFREIFRKKREAAKKAEQDKKQDVQLKESVFLREDRQRIYEQWNRVGKRLVEYQLTPQQVQALFGQIEQAATSAGGNRTLAGRGVDKASELNAAWEGLKGKIQQSHPVKGFDDLYDQAAAKLKTATGGDQGVMQYVNKYRAFAKEHPYIQSAVYAALIAAAGLSGAGLGGAAVLGLLKMTDKLIQGEKFSSAAYAGAKTGALAYGAGQLAQYFKNPDAAIPPGTPAKLPDGTEYVVQKGDTLSQIAQRNGVSVKDLMAANSGQTVPTGDRITWNDPNAFTDINPMGDAVPAGTGAEQTYDVRTKLTNPDVLQPGQKLNVPGSLGPTQTYADGVGTAADTWNKVNTGEYTPSEISRNQAAKYNLPGAGDYRPTGGGAASNMAPPTTSATDIAAGAASSGKPALTPKGGETNYADSKTNPLDRANAKVDADVAKANAEVEKSNAAAQEKYNADMEKYNDEVAKVDAENAKNSADYSDKLAKNPGSPVAYDDNGDLMPGWVKDPAKPGFLKFNVPELKESRIYMMFDSIVAGQRRLDEGVWDTVKGAAAKAGDWAKTKGQNITTKVTLDKLLQAWNKAQKPTDSETIKNKVLIPAGVAPEIIDSVYASMKIPSAPAPTAAQQPDVYGRIEPTMTATPAAARPVATPAARPAASTTAPASVKGQLPANASAWNYSGAVKTPGVPQPTKQVVPGYTIPSLAATPSWADPNSGDYVGRREVARRQAAQQAQPAAKTVAEANKKKDDDLEPQIKDVSLQRAISRAKADFPTAGSGIEALSKDFMRSQEQDQKSLDQIRDIDRQQDLMLKQIDRIDQQQNDEIAGLEDQNSSLTKRLQQLQSVNSQLEKKLANMSGRREKASSEKEKVSSEPISTGVVFKSPSATTEPKAKSKPKAAKTTPKEPSAMKSTAAQLAAPKADPIAAMTQRITKGDSSITDKVSKQSALPFEPSDNILEPTIPQRQQNPRYAAAQRDASDVDPRYFKDIAAKAKKDMTDAGKAHASYPDAERLRTMVNKTLENEEQEDNYGKKYQDMVTRVGQTAREQEKSKPVDIKDLARRLAAIEASKKDK